jgi:uncharacterized protein YdaU (DUF1376 family)
MHEYQEKGECLPYDDLTFHKIAKDLNEDISLVKKVITDCVKKFNLFKIKSKNLCSNRVDENIDHLKKSKQQRVEAGVKSGQARKRKKETERPLNEVSTTVERPLNEVSTTVERPLNENEQIANSKQQIANIAIKDSNNTTLTKIASNASDEELKNAAAIAFANLDKELPVDFLNEQVAKILKNRNRILPISNIGKFVKGWLSKIEKNGEQVPYVIEINGQKHFPKKVNGHGVYCHPTIKAKKVDKKNKEVVLVDNSRIKLKGGDLVALENGNLIIDKFYKGMKY